MRIVQNVDGRLQHQKQGTALLFGHLDRIIRRLNDGLDQILEHGGLRRHHPSRLALEEASMRALEAGERLIVPLELTFDCRRLDSWKAAPCRASKDLPDHHEHVERQPMYGR